MNAAGTIVFSEWQYGKSVPPIKVCKTNRNEDIVTFLLSKGNAATFKIANTIEQQ